MINFKNRDEVLPSALILLAILILSCSLAFMLFVPTPSTAGITKGKERSREQLEKEIATAKTRVQEATGAVQSRFWEGAPDTVTAAALARLTGEANRRRLQIGAFRPQKPQPLEGLTELPYSVQISGPYPAIRSFMATLDAADSKIVLRSVQISGADAASSQVTATLGISAYIPASAATTEKGSANG